jgi:single-stranded-DNA-specific exonuclease
MKTTMLEFLTKYKKNKEEHFSYNVSHKKINYFLEKIIRALVEKKKIFLWGDYDVDGMASTALMVDIIRDFATFSGIKETNIKYHIPSRADGYGINKNAFIAHSATSDLIITIDNGTHREFFNSLSDEDKKNILIFDHHPNGDFSNEKCVINPNVNGDVKICTGILVELIFKALRVTFKEYGEHRHENYFSDLAAMTLISDMASLNNDQVRKDIERGLAVASKRGRAVFKLLVPEFKGDISMTSMAFDIIPVINSIGRMSESPSWAVDVLLQKKVTGESRALIDNAVLINNMRKSLTDQYSKKIIKTIEENHAENDLLMHGHVDDIPIGINGIIAANVFNKFGRDVIVTSNNYSNGGIMVGSGRGVDIREKLLRISEEAEDAFHFGGHNQAVGVKINDPIAFDLARKNFCDKGILAGDKDKKAEKFFVLDRTVTVGEYLELCDAYSLFIGGDVKFMDQFNVKLKGMVVTMQEYRNDFLKLGIVDVNTGEKLHLLSKKDDKINYLKASEDIFEISVSPLSKNESNRTVGVTLRSANEPIFLDTKDVSVAVASPKQ